MGLRKPLNNAWEEMESINKPVNNAWQECTEVCKPLNGAWQAVWRAVEMLVKSSNTITRGSLDISSDGLKFYYSKDVNISGTGTIVFYFEGDWVNPQISFDWEGYMYRTNTSETTWYTNSAGDISIYSRTTAGAVTTTKVVSSVGKSENGSLSNSDGWSQKGSYSGTLEGSFNRLGLSINIAGYSYTTEPYNAWLEMTINNLKFNKQKIGFPKSAEFSY